jgi:hypothetical protein
VVSAMRLLLSLLTTLRSLSCDAETASGAVVLQGSQPCSDASGCSDRLHRLSALWSGSPRLPFTAPFAFPLLTELSLSVPMKDGELELLLSGCPQLLKLTCGVWQSWTVVLIAARCCRCFCN